MPTPSNQARRTPYLKKRPWTSTLGWDSGIRRLLQQVFGIRWDSGFGIRKLLQLLFGIRLGFVLGFAKLLQLCFGIPWDSGFGIRSFLQLPFGIRFGIRSTFTNSDGQLHMESTTPRHGGAAGLPE